MIGDILWSLAGVANTILGDPAGAIGESIDRCESRDKHRKNSQESFYHEQLMHYEAKLNRELSSSNPSTGLIELYEGFVSEYKEKIMLLK